jgi:LuxR family transcriptional regulator, maltose regulon positive regulatory protein
VKALTARTHPAGGRSDERRSAPLVTQLMVPRQPRGYVPRPRLIERLSGAVAEPVTLLCGPAGSGKTALLTSWVSDGQAPGAVAWVSLESADDDAYGLWAAVLAALGRAGAIAPESSLAALLPPVRDAAGAFLPLLVNGLAELPEPVVLILDDVDVLRSRESLGQLAFLLQHMPETLRVVLSVRADPPLPLHVLRLRGRLTEIRGRDLAFTRPEAAELLAAHGLALDQRLVETLWARTEGWAAGLRLAALGLQGDEDPAGFVADFAGDDRVVGDYLLAEVLDRQPPRRRAFLLQTSIVDRLCGELADAITGESTGEQTLAELERTNAFVVGLDTQRRWYRYHRLFAELLRARLGRQPAGELQALHRRAARWYAADASGWEALRHAVAGEDWDLVIEVVAEHWFELFVRGRAGSMAALLERLPPERVHADAELSAAIACTLLENGDSAAAREHLAAAERATPDVPASRRRRHLETLAIARLCAARVDGDFDGALAAADELLAEAARDGGWSGDARQAFARCHLGVAAFWSGRFDRARDELARSLDIARSARLDHLEVTSLSHLAMLEAVCEGPARAVPPAREALALAARRGWTGMSQLAPAHAALASAALSELRLAEAEAEVAEARAASDPGETHVRIVLAHVSARLLMTQGRPDAALRELAAIEFQLGAPPSARRGKTMLATLRARVLLAIGETARAQELIDALRSGEDPVAELEIVAAQVALSRGQPEAALRTARRGIGSDPAAVLGLTRVELLTLAAVSHAELGDGPAAAASLELALAAADETGHLWPFVVAGRQMRDLLRAKVRDGTAHRALVGDLLDLFEHREPARRAAAPLLEPLSEREQAVLRYLPTSLSNREIAAEMFVTANTVKTHLRSIYRKLDVARRREAVERARELRLLASGGRR